MRYLVLTVGGYAKCALPTQHPLSGEFLKLAEDLIQLELGDIYDEDVKYPMVEKGTPDLSIIEVDRLWTPGEVKAYHDSKKPIEAPPPPPVQAVPADNSLEPSDNSFDDDIPF